MENHQNENAAYMNFIDNLNEILVNYNINQLNCS